MALPKLTATDEMKQIATSDLPRKEKTDYGYVREVCEYYTYLRCIKQDGILKVAFFFPEHLRLDGSNPAYEVYLDKEKRQFITYNSLIQKWSESKLDRLDWKRQYWYTKAYWISDEDETSIQAYLNINKKAVEAIRQFQRHIGVVLYGMDRRMSDAKRALRNHACFLCVCDGRSNVTHVVQSAERTGNVCSLCFLYFVE